MPRRFALLAIAASCITAGCQVLPEDKVSVDYYSISGNSTEALDNEIRRKGPRIGVAGKHAVAVARIRMVPTIDYRKRGDACSIRAAKVNVNARVTLPRWTGRPMASKKLGEAWDNIDRYTRLHESVHVAIAFRFARLMEAELLDLPAEADCSTMRRSSAALVRSVLAEHDRTQLQFDADEQKRFEAYAALQPQVRQ
ncbi:MAG: DUF922 domain-containing protein [Pseudomonadota bacterium]